MLKKIYETVEMSNGIKMMSILLINETGIAEAYCITLLGTQKVRVDRFHATFIKSLGLKMVSKTLKCVVKH